MSKIIFPHFIYYVSHSYTLNSYRIHKFTRIKSDLRIAPSWREAQYLQPSGKITVVTENQIQYGLDASRQSMYFSSLDGAKRYLNTIIEDEMQELTERILELSDRKNRLSEMIEKGVEING